MKKLIFSAIFLLSFTIYICAQDEAQKVSVVWQVKKYDISASIAERTLNSKATLTLQNVSTTTRSQVTLRLNQNAEVASVKLGNEIGAFAKGKDEKISSSSNLQKIMVSFPGVAPNSTVSFTLDYKIKFDENNGLHTLSPMGSQMLPLSYWYPAPNSWYSPAGADFAPTNIQFSGADTVITPAPGLNSQPFFIAGNWDLAESQGVSVYIPKGFGEAEKLRAGELANIASSAKAFMAAALGESDVKLKLIGARRGAGFADSGVILLDYGAFRRQKIDSQTVMTIAESVAKIWIGNIKQVKGEGFGVIREGLARYLANEFLEKQFGPEAAENERARQRASYANIAKSEAPINQTSPLDSTFYISSANKGAMIWRLIANQMGRERLLGYIKSQQALTLTGIRTSFSETYDVLDHPLANANDTNLLAGLPLASGGETKVNLRNAGSIAATVNILAITDKGERLTAKATIQPTSFGEAIFKTTSKIIRTEIDPEKFYPQTEYSDDVAPREFTENNFLTAIKRSFDKQDFAGAEKAARIVLQRYPNMDEARAWLGRALLLQNKLIDAEREFKAAINEKLPSAFTLSWGNAGLGEIALKSDQRAAAAKFFDNCVKADGEFGAMLAGRMGRQKAESAPVIDESIRSFFAQMDKAAVSGRKAEIDAQIAPGEFVRFSNLVFGSQPEKWQTQVLRTEKIDANYAIAETNLSLKKLGKEEPETGMAVFILAKSGNSWKLAGYEVFEVR